MVKNSVTKKTLKNGDIEITIKTENGKTMKLSVFDNIVMVHGHMTDLNLCVGYASRLECKIISTYEDGTIHEIGFTTEN